MPNRPKPIRRYPVSIRVATTEGERKEMRRAADRLNLPLSTWLRSVGVEKVRGAKAT
jgi:hypothetical protein